ncbi:MAG: methyltransferase domain-containing protein [Sorangiineae bacterium]|nr:methyltransferase domain-containing protein [Polyangiaceae bacterium]MEB2321134.1 methyltransferase domain-containing protein [Sorangiineae bacterium]
MAMRVITIRKSVDEAPPEFDVEFPAEQGDEAASILESTEELSDDDVAPDSGGAPSAGEPKRSAPAAPPPPPKRSARAQADDKPSPPSLADSRRPQRRPWWEEIFSEDFVRASYRIPDAVIAREVDFIEESLGVAPGGVVLDLGCGDGHHAVELASRGYGVVGYDLSLYQLALAADVAQDRGQKINFLQGDMREMAFEEMFDGIFCWNTTFGYFEEEKNFAVAQRVFKALKPGGMFLIDVVNRDFVAADQPNQLWYEGDACVCMDDMSVDFITSRLRVKRTLILDDGRSRECSYSVRLYALHELGKVLHDVGFRVTEASGSPMTPGVFFGNCSPRIIILAQRP